MTNPRKRRNSRRRRRSNPHAVKSHRRRNAFFHSRRRRRNPVNIGGMDMTSVLKVSAGAAIGGVATRGLTQMVLQSSNTDGIGYLANAVAALGLGWLTGKFAGKDVGLGVMAGGIAATIQRVWSEKVSQLSPSAMSGLGDLDYSSSGLGAYADSYFPMPTVSAQSGGYLLSSGPNAGPSGIAGRASGGVQPVAPASAPIARYQAARLGM